MNETDVSKIAWRRGETGPTYVGGILPGPESIRLTGRDPVLGIDVSLSIPVDEIEYVGVAECAGEAPGGVPYVVLDLAESEAIYLRPVGSAPLHVHLLAQVIGASTHAPAVLAQGG